MVDDEDYKNNKNNNNSNKEVSVLALGSLHVHHIE